MPFGKVLCTSVNDAVLHGLPRDYRCGTATCSAWTSRHPSTAGWPTPRISIVVGTPREEDLRLIDTIERALGGRHRAPPGRAIGWGTSPRRSAPSRTPRATRSTRDFGGHGVGRTMHGDPHVPNDGRPGRGLPLRPGLVFAIEPWLMQSTDRVFTDPDGWTLRSVDGSRGAHSEHTIAITADGPRPHCALTHGDEQRPVNDATVVNGRVSRHT